MTVMSDVSPRKPYMISSAIAAENLAGDVGGDASSFDVGGVVEGPPKSSAPGVPALAYPAIGVTSSWAV